MASYTDKLDPSQISYREDTAFVLSFFANTKTSISYGPSDNILGYHTIVLHVGNSHNPKTLFLRDIEDGLRLMLKVVRNNTP